MRMLIFFTVFTIVFGSLGYYLYNRITHSFDNTFISSKTFSFIYIFLLSSMIFGKIIENYHINIFSESLVRIGAVSLGVFFYALLFVIFFDILRLINHFLPFYPAFLKNNIESTRFWIGTISSLIIFALVAFGTWNSFNPKVKTLDLNISKKVEGLQSLNVVAISDIHLGSMVNHKKAKKLIEQINILNPDLVLIAGDIIDDNIKVVKKYGLLEHFNDLNPKYGVHGIMGNHEYIGRSFTDLPYYQNNNINMIIDSSILIDDKFYIVGRDDIQAKAMYNKSRSELNDLMVEIDQSKPIFLLDHQPYNLIESQSNGIDLHFSGHTHHGQFWPLNWITGAIFEQDWGYLKKGNSHFYISCGYGTAGPPLRIGSHPEIVQLKINFD